MVEDLLREALDSALSDGVRFADCRLYPHHRIEYLSIRNGETELMSFNDEMGLGVRVLRECGWGFAGTTRLTRACVRETAKRAVKLARAAELRGTKIPFASEERLPRGDSYSTRLKEDPFEVSVEEKVEMLLEAEKRLHVAPSIKSGKAEYSAWHEEKHYLSSEGASYTSNITHVGAGIVASAISGSDAQRRSFPNSFGGDFAQSGFEFIRSLDLVENAENSGKTADRLLSAPAAPSGKMNLVISSDQLSLQVHESVGHATELDRVLAFEAGFAGTSFVGAKERGKLRYGSPKMTVVADATVPGALGTFGWDDDGVPAKRVEIVRKGTLAGFLSSREMAGRLGLTESGGTLRGDGSLRMPLIRMTNVNLEPGDYSREEIFEEAKDGIYVETNVSWSIDDKRLNFQFGTEVGMLIEDGEVTKLVRDPIYSGMTPQFWGSLVAAGDARTYHSWGLPNCGKGQPQQVMHVAHGAPIGLFKDIKVGGVV